MDLPWINSFDSPFKPMFPFLFWSSLQALSEKPWSNPTLKEFWSFGIVLGISVGGMFHWMICFCWPCLMMYFGHAWCIYIYCLIVALFFKYSKCFQMLLFKKKEEKNRKRMKLNKRGLVLRTWTGLRTWLILLILEVLGLLFNFGFGVYYFFLLPTYSPLLLYSFGF